MPTRKGGPRQPRQRVERAEVESPRRESERTTPAPAQPKTMLRNPLFPVGVSLYPLEAETQRPEDSYRRDPSADLDVLATARCTLVRAFVSWRVVEPQVGQYDEEALDRLVGIVSAARERKMQTIICLFADDRHAELSEVSWGKRRDPRTDQYLVQREVALVQKVVGRFRAEAGVFAWQLGNEAFLSGFDSEQALREWFDMMREAVREVDDSRPIGLGADAETLFRATGVDARRSIDECEFAYSHVTAAYHAYAAEGPLTSGPSTYLDAFLLRAAHRGRPVLLDEVGALGMELSAEEEASYLRSALWSGFMNRAAGAMVRRFRDMDIERREPYFTDPFETIIGVADNEGITKPSFQQLETFVRTVSRIDLASHVLIAERTAVMVPAERYEQLPSLAGLYAPRSCFQSFIAAKRAHIPVTVMSERDAFDDHLVIIVPCAFKLDDDTWGRLVTFVQGGGTLLYSYGGGDSHPAARELFGVDFLGDGGPRHVLSCRVAQPDVLGALASFDVHFEVPNFALLTGGDATVVATDSQGNPLLTVNQVGQGRAVFLAAPLERAVGQGDPWATPAPVNMLLREVYGAVARAAGCGAPVRCSVPDVEVAIFQGELDDVLVLLNHSADKVEAALSVDRRVASISDVRGGTPVAVGGNGFTVSLEPNGATALRLTYA